MTLKKIVTSSNIITLLTWMTYTIALLPIVPYHVNSKIMIAWALLSLCSFFIQRKNTGFASHSGLNLFIVFGGNFVLLLLSMLYTKAPKEGAETLVALLPMLFFPFILFLLPVPQLVTQKNIQRTLLVFWASNLALGIWLLFSYASLDLLEKFDTINSLNNPIRLAAERITDIHPTYLSLFFGFSACIAGLNFINSKNLALRLLYVLSILLFTFHLISLASRTPIFAIFIALLIVGLLKIKKPIQRFLIITGMLFFAFILIRFTPSIYSRLIEIQQTTLTVPVGDQYNSTNIRVGILQCSWEVIQKNIIIGGGVGSEKPLLNECYSKFETDGYKNVYYNTHNQYLNLWLIGGIASLILFIYSLFYAVRTAIRVKDYLLLFFIILVSLTFLTENILSRHAGVVFFYFFLCLMMAYHKQTIDKSSTQYPSTTE